MANVIHLSDRVVFRQIENGGVLLHLDSGEYFSLNPMGCRIWIEARGSTLENLLEKLRGIMPDAPSFMEEEVTEFVAELSKRGILHLEEEP